MVDFKFYVIFFKNKEEKKIRIIILILITIISGYILTLYCFFFLSHIFVH